MTKRGYAIAFGFVALAACLGAAAAVWFLSGRGPVGLPVRSTWQPPAGPTVVAAVPQPGETLTPAPATPRTTPTRPGIPTPFAPTLPPVFFGTLTPLPPLVPGETPRATPDLNGTPTPTETAGPTATPVPDFAFTAFRVRNSSGDCPGTYVLGRVFDRSGTPLADVRLSLVDEYGNAEGKVSKGGGDAGHYDFPLFGVPRRFYISVVDAAGKPQSQPVEVFHLSGPNPQASCHWVDWQRR